MNPILVSSITFFSTLLGGLVGLRYQRYLNLLLGFTAGVVLGVVAFDIFPEIFEQVKALDIPPTGPMIALIAGFLIFHILEKTILIHASHEEDFAGHHHPSVGIASAVALIGHSFMDGVGIGLAFQVSPVVGATVAIAVVAHDFSDGLNTVTLVLLHKNSDFRARLLLLFDAIAPVVGAASTLFFTISNNFLVYYLGLFAGFLLYISTSDILPDAHRAHSSGKIILMTLFGVTFIFLVTKAF